MNGQNEKVMKLTGGSLLYVTARGWFGQRTEKTENEQVDKLVKLLPPAYFEEIKGLQGELYGASRPYTLPFPIRGVRFVPDALLPKVEARLNELKEKYSQAADKLMDNYESAKREAQFNLGEKYNEKNYPTAEQLRSAYKVNFTVFSVDASEAVLQNALGVGDLLAEFQATAYESLVSQFKEALSAMVERLEDSTTGRRKRIVSSAVEGFQQFVEDFSSLASAIKKDSKQGASMQEVERLAECAKQLMNGVTPDLLREDKNVRNTVQMELAKVGATLDNIMVEVGSRSFVLD